MSQQDSHGVASEGDAGFSRLNRKERRATLLSDRTMFMPAAPISWGWRKVAQLRPGWEPALLFDVLILPFPLRSSSS
jgi:hypothetical protein